MNMARKGAYMATLNDTDKQVLKDTFSCIPQVQALKMVRTAVSPQDLAQQIMQAAGIRALTADQQAAIMNLMSLDKAGREVLAGQIIGTVIESIAPNLLQKIFYYLTFAFYNPWKGQGK